MLSLALLAGLISFTSPCTLPLLPGYVAYISGLPPGPAPRPDRAGADSAGREAVAVAVLSRRRALSAALLFILGFTTVFVSLGATSSALGFLLVRHLRTLQTAAGILIIAMGLVTAGLLKLPLLMRQRRRDLSGVRRGPAGAAALGASFAFGWTPCVGPVLASILATAATSGAAGAGAVLLAAYSLGLGLPFLLVAAGVARGQHRLGWLRRHGRHIEIAGGILLIVMGIAMLTGGWTTLMSRMLAAYARVGWPPL